MNERKDVRWHEVKPGDRFYTTEKARIAYRKLPDSSATHLEMYGPETCQVHEWVREDWSAKPQSLHSWSGDPFNNTVWIEVADE